MSKDVKFFEFLTKVVQLMILFLPLPGVYDVKSAVGFA